MADDMHARVRAILMRDWDPIGIGDQPKLAEEYDAYVPAIVAMIRARQSADALAAQLLQIEKTKMGLAGNTARAQSVAGKLLGAV